MKISIIGIARKAFRKLVPASLRRKIWNSFVRDYFERKSIKSIIAYSRNSKIEPTKEIVQLIAILEKNKHRPVYAKIKEAMGLDFRGYSCQDLIAYIFFNGKTNGFFVDIGAFDGLGINNTFALELIDWEGICVEPIPEIFKLLRQNRNCHLYNAAVALSSDTEVEFLVAEDHQGLSGLAHQMPDRIRDGLAGQGIEITKIDVDTMTFDDILIHHPKIVHIDFLSIDVEGGEIDVLGSIDFDKFEFGLITIENNAGVGTLNGFMEKKGYIPFMDLGVDLMFVPT